MIGTALVILVLLVEVGAIMRCGKVYDRAHWDNAGRVHALMAAVIMLFDVGNVDGLGDARMLKKGRGHSQTDADNPQSGAGCI